MLTPPPTIPLPLRPDHANRGYLVGITRIHIDVVIGDYLMGSTPEDIVANYERLTLPDVYTVLAWYLANREVVDEHLRERQEEGMEITRKLDALPGVAEKKARFLAKVEEYRRKQAEGK